MDKMDKMNGQKEAAVMRGMSNVHSGLGMLLGAGRISAATHDRILVLINAEEAPEPKNHSIEPKDHGIEPKDHGIEEPEDPEPKDHSIEKPYIGRLRPRTGTPSSSLASLNHGMANVGRRGPSARCRKSTAGVFLSSTKTQDTWYSAIPDPPPSSQNSHSSEPPLSNLVCPWYSTPGYNCREHLQGKCSWLHESSPDAITEPLICSFWAENLCNKADEDCRFAHYWAQHRQIAPSPTAKFMRNKHVPKQDWS